MNRWYLIAVLAVCGVGVYSARERPESDNARDSQTKPSNKPEREIEFHIDGGPGPAASVEELWEAADIVVEGRILSETPIDDLFTSYEVQIVEVFKSDAAVRKGASTLTVSRMGGVRDKGAYVERRVEKGFPLFEQGEQYVLFLDDLQNGRYTLAAEGAFLITPTNVQHRGRGQAGLAFKANPELLRLTLRGKGGAR